MILLAVPRIQDTLLNDDLKAATRHIIGAAGQLRDESVREQTDYILHIDLGNQAFWTYTAMRRRKKGRNSEGRVPLPEGSGSRRYGGPMKAGRRKARWSSASPQGYVDPAVIHLPRMTGLSPWS